MTCINQVPPPEKTAQCPVGPTHERRSNGQGFIRQFFEMNGIGLKSVQELDDPPFAEARDMSGPAVIPPSRPLRRANFESAFPVNMTSTPLGVRCCSRPLRTKAGSNRCSTTSKRVT